MAVFDLDFDASVADRFLAELLKQTPFAMAVALTRTAQDVQAELRERLDDDGFTIRTSWVQRRIRIRRATKGRLEARVGSKDAFMVLHLEGGTKVGGGLPNMESELLSVPVGARPSPGAVTRPGKFPGALLRRKKFFLGATAGGTPAVFQRLGSGGRKLRLMWILVPRVQIPKRWRFMERVESTVRKRWAVNMREALARAIKTARIIK